MSEEVIETLKDWVVKSNVDIAAANKIETLKEWVQKHLRDVETDARQVSLMLRPMTRVAILASC